MRKDDINEMVKEERRVDKEHEGQMGKGGELDEMRLQMKLLEDDERENQIHQK